MSANGNDGEHASPDVPTEAYLAGTLTELVARMGRVEASQKRLERISVATADNLMLMMKRTDPLSWVRRGLILGACSFLGSGIAAAIVHTLYLAYFRTH